MDTERIPASEATKGMTDVQAMKWLLQDAKKQDAKLNEIIEDYKRILNIKEKEKEKVTK